MGGWGTVPPYIHVHRPTVSKASTPYMYVHLKSSLPQHPLYCVTPRDMPPRNHPDTASEASSGASDATPTFWDSLNRFNDVRPPPSLPLCCALRLVLLSPRVPVHTQSC